MLQKNPPCNNLFPIFAPRSPFLIAFLHTLTPPLSLPLPLPLSLCHPKSLTCPGNDPIFLSLLLSISAFQTLLLLMPPSSPFPLHSSTTCSFSPSSPCDLYSPISMSSHPPTAPLLWDIPIRAGCRSVCSQNTGCVSVAATCTTASSASASCIAAATPPTWTAQKSVTYVQPLTRHTIHNCGCVRVMF